MVCSFIRVYDNKRELLLGLTLELENNDISYSILNSTDNVYRVKANCSKSKLHFKNKCNFIQSNT
ncbi:MAG: hypothetical protein HRU03_05705 [Nanoarchaeales archaeon]|nr:hypothetical protein [Nanoarchaeales archaeon]